MTGSQEGKSYCCDWQPGRKELLLLLAARKERVTAVTGSQEGKSYCCDWQPGRKELLL